jgi:nicotinamidase-related amidase
MMPASNGAKLFIAVQKFSLGVFVPLRLCVKLIPLKILSVVPLCGYQWCIAPTRANFAMQTLDPNTTALILIDLQKGVVARPLAPYAGPDVLKTGIDLAGRFRKAGAPVVLVNVGWSPDFKDALRQPVDLPLQPPPGGFPPEFMELADGLAQPGDLRITKRQWGAFHGTELDLQLRRRHIQTIVLGGIATNIGVESTARQAWEHGYALVVVEDATSGQSAEMHHFSFKHILPRISRIAKAADIRLEGKAADR